MVITNHSFNSSTLSDVLCRVGLVHDVLAELYHLPLTNVLRLSILELSDECASVRKSLSPDGLDISVLAGHGLDEHRLVVTMSPQVVGLCLKSKTIFALDQRSNM